MRRRGRSDAGPHFFLSYPPSLSHPDAVVVRAAAIAPPADELHKLDSEPAMYTYTSKDRSLPQLHLRFR